jgi:hypothetical protein
MHRFVKFNPASRAFLLLSLTMAVFFTGFLLIDEIGRSANLS